MPTSIRTRALLTLVLLAPATAVEAQTPRDLYPELSKLVALDGGSSDYFGQSVSMAGDMLVVGAPYDDVGAIFNAGSVRVFVRNGGVWTLQQTLTASDGAVDDQFGTMVSLSGDTLAVGAPGDDVGANLNQGSVRVFVRSGGVWTPQQTLTASDGAADDRFGEVVSLSGDTVAVGVPYDDVGANVNQGSVRMFVRSSNSWSAATTLTASDGAANDQYGGAVSLSGDLLAIGARYDDVGANSDQGSVRMFSRVAGLWSAQGTLTAADGVANDEFGAAVSLSGNTVAVGAPYDELGAFINQGSVRVFTRIGSSWVAQATVAAPDAKLGASLGWTVSLLGDVLAAGAPFEDGSLGTVRMFVRSGSSWTFHSKLTASDGMPVDRFGYAISLSEDALAAGALLDDVAGVVDQGSVSMFGSYRVWNQTRGIGSATLASAVGSALSGDRLLVGNLGFAEASGVINATQKPLTFTALEPSSLGPTALLSVGDNTVFERSPAVSSGGLSVAGKLIAPNLGTMFAEQLTIASGGQFVQRGAAVFVNQSLATGDGGVCYLEGTLGAESLSTSVGGQNRVAGDTDVFANYTNAGATVIQRGILYIYGTLTNTGTITGNFNNGFLPPNPGDGYAIGGDYIVSADSSIILAEPVWWLRVGGNFDVAINDPARFVMDQATLELTGVGPASLQSVEVLSRDLGAVDAGFATSNYPLGALRLRSGANVELANNHSNAPGKGTEAIYTQQLVVPAGSTLTTNGYKIYTRAATIAGTVSNPSDIVVVPSAPPCPADLFPNGTVDAADLGILLSSWGPCTGSCVADLNGDTQVGAADLAILLSSWGSCLN